MSIYVVYNHCSLDCVATHISHIFNSFPIIQIWKKEKKMMKIISAEFKTYYTSTQFIQKIYYFELHTLQCGTSTSLFTNLSVKYKVTTSITRNIYKHEKCDSRIDRGYGLWI